MSLDRGTEKGYDTLEFVCLNIVRAKGFKAMRRANNLGQDPVGRLVLRLAIPTMLAQLVSVLYSIVDRMYIGQIPGVGDLALAGVGVCGPVVTMVGSAAVWISWGASPLMGIRMGEGRPEEARRILRTGFCMLLAFSLAMMALVIPLREPMLRFFGASDATYPYADAYFTVYLTGTVFALLAAGLNQMIIAQGFAAQAMRLVVLGAALNIALDPVFIFALNMGVRGAALATVFSQMASAAGAVIFLRGRRAAIRLERGGLSLPAARKILTLGFTPFAIIAIDNVMLIAMNAVLQRYGGALEGDRLVTCAVIAQSFMLVMTMPLGGISGGTQSILSYNYGARQFGRVRDAQKKIFRLCMGFTAIMFVLARAAGPLFVRLFTKDAQVAEISAWAIRVCTLAAIPLGAQYEIVDGFTALGQVRLSFPLSFFRKAVYFAALFILPACFGARAAFYAEPVSDVLGPLASAIAYKLCIGSVLSDGHARV